MVCKFRVRFQKTGLLRLVSHHDLMRAFERMLRRAGLPFRSTSGFHPQPRIIFALSLPLGVSALDEVVELELTEEVPADDVLERLKQQAPAGLRFSSIRAIPLSTTAQVCRAVYRLPAPAERLAALREQCALLLAGAECWVERSRPEPRKINIRPYILGLQVETGALEMDLRVTPTGSARADEVVQQLGCGDLLEAGAVLERTKLDLIDEQTVVSSPSSISLMGPIRPIAIADQRLLTEQQGNT
ncbi:MAG TPA: TIGR03936 family radical SAM-associated protein [Gemmataceae bacterium]|jgi:radical SAM-linked protein|nr:TIGR03936 family radical SAM-associated protein [Gemmataceae bacterium]